MDLIRRLARPLFWAALVFAYVAAVMPAAEAPKISDSDKVEHMLAFFTLAVLGRLGYPATPAIVTALLLACFGAVIEFSQLIPALHRDGNLADWVADVAALGAGILLVALASRRRIRAPN